MHRAVGRITQIKRNVSLGLGLLDQVVLSLSTILCMIVVASASTPQDLGLFVSGISTIQMITAVIRSMAGETLIILPYKRAEEQICQVKSSLAFSLVVSVGVSIVGWSLLMVDLGSLVRSIAVGLIVLPGVVVHDQFRFVLNRRGAWGTALLLDCVVASLQIGILLVGFYGDVSIMWQIFLWGGVSYVVSIVILRWEHVSINLGSFRYWMQQSRGYYGPFVVEALIGAMVQWLILASVVAFASLSDVAAYRSVVSIFGVTSVVLSFFRSTVLAMIVSRGPMVRGKAIQAATAMFVFALLVIGASWLIFRLVPRNVGEALFGATWVLIVPLLTVGALSRLAMAVATIPAVLLRSGRATWNVTRIRILIGVASATVVPPAAYLWGAEGALWSQTLLSLVTTVLLWITLEKLLE